MTFWKILGNFYSSLNLAAKKNNESVCPQSKCFEPSISQISKEIWALQVAMEELVKVKHVLAESQTQLIQLSLFNQLRMFEDQKDTMNQFTQATA
jgi:hypothetical protein